MVSVGSVELSVKLGLAQLLKDADTARLALQKQLQDQKIELDLITGPASAKLSQLSAQILQAKAAASQDAGEAAGLQRQVATLQEMLRYKQQLVEIEESGFSDEDVVNAKALAAELNKLNLDRINKEFDGLQQEIAKTEKQSSTFIGKLNQQAQAFQDSVSASSQYTQALSIASGQLGALGGQITQFTQQAGAAAVAFDSAKAKVATLSNDSENLASRMRDLSSELGFQSNSTDLLNASYDVLSSGISETAEIAEVLKASTQGALGGFSDVGTVSDAVTTLISAYKTMGYTAADATKIVDQLAQTQDKGKVTIGQLASQIGQVASSAALAGVSMEEIFASVATATAKGQDSSSAISGVRQAIVNLLKPTDEAQKYLKKFGVENSAAALKAGGLVGILEKLKAGGASTDELAKIFSDVTGLATVATLANENLGDFKTNLDAMSNSAGKAALSAEKVANSMQGQMTAAMNQANEALVDLGNGVTKATVPLLSALTKLIEYFNELPTPVKEAVGLVLALTGGAITLAGGLAGVAAILPSLNAGLKLVGINAASAGTGMSAAGTGATAASVGFKSAAIGVGALALKLGLITAAIGVLKEVMDRFKDGGGEFKDSAEQIRGKLAELETQAGKTKEQIKSVLPDEPPPTGFIDGIVTEINKSQKVFNDKLGLPKDFLIIPTDAQKQLTDVREGVFEFQNELDNLGFKASTFKGTKEEAKALQETFDVAIEATQNRLNSLDASKLGTDAYAELSKQLTNSVTVLKSQKEAFEKSNGLLEKNATATKAVVDKNAEAVKAVEAVTKAYGENTNALDAAYKLRQTEIAQSVAQGFTTEEEARQQNLDAEKDYLTKKLALNTSTLAQLKESSKSVTDPEKLKEVKDQILGIEQQIADGRLAIAQNGIAQRKAAEEEALKDLQDKITEAENRIGGSKTDRTIGVKRDQASGAITDEQAATEIAKIEQDSIRETIELRRFELAENQRLKALGKKSAEEAAETEIQLTQEIGSLTLQQIDAEIAARRAADQERERAQGQLIKDIQDGAQKQSDAATLAAQNQITAIKQAQLAGVTSAEEAAQKITEIQANSIDENLRIKEDELARIQELQDSGRLTSKEKIEEAANYEKTLIRDIAGLKQQAVEADIAAQDAVKQKKIEAINQELESEQRAAEIRSTERELAVQALETENNLYSAQSSLLQSQSNLRQQRLQNAIEEAEKNGESNKAEELKKKLIDEQIRLQERQARIEVAQLKNQQEMNRLKLEDEQATARIAFKEAEIELRQARINGATDEEISDLQEILGLRGDQLIALNSQAAAQESINQMEMRNLTLKQQQTREAQALQKAEIEGLNTLIQKGKILSNPGLKNSGTTNPGGGAHLAQAGEKSSGFGGGGSSFNGFGQPPDITSITDRLTDLGNAGDLSTVFQTANLGLKLKLGGLTPGGLGSTAPAFGGADNGAILGKLDQMIAATKASGGRPNLSISNVNDLGLAGQIYGDISRDSFRSAGL